MRRSVRNGTLALLALASGGVLVAASGVVPIRASEGHWALTHWALKFAMRRSVTTHALGIDAPALDDPGLVAKGATHYETGCRPCHGSPGRPPPVIARRMTPFPPSLSTAAERWDPEELFYIVKHGVKFTGMPAWPAPGRDDEVWAVVAFLSTLPTSTAEGYARTARAGFLSDPAPARSPGAADPPSVVAENCARCHGLDGAGHGLGVFPVLAGQRPDYLLASLAAYADGARPSGIMQPVAAGLDEPTLREAARYYASQAPPPSAAQPATAAAEIERGRSIAASGIPAQRLPACAACHGPGDGPRNPLYPILAGQPAEYLAAQLALFRSRGRGGTAYAHVMTLVGGRLTRQQSRDVAAYYASLPRGADSAPSR